MNYFLAIASKHLNQVLSVIAPELTLPVQNDFEFPTDFSRGDLAYPCFKLAKALKKSPAAIATEIANEWNKTPPPGLHGEAVQGYFNVRISWDLLIHHYYPLFFESKNPFGSEKPASKGVWVFEFSSPNVAKPFLVGHLRSTAIGAALARAAKFRGHQTITINHLGDWGTQYGKLFVAYRHFGAHLPQNASIQDLVSIYIQFHDEVVNRPELEDEAREAFRKLEQGDPEVTAFWKKCVSLSLKEFQKIYDRLDVHFDHIWGESFYRDQLAPLLKTLEPIAVESDGAWVVRLPPKNGQEIPPCILQKKDGATIYATRDLAAAIYRYNQFKFEKMTYVVGSEQRLHFEQVFGVLKLAGYEWVDRCEHVPFGLYRFKGGKMSTRKGHYITLEEVLSEVRASVSEVLHARTQDTSKDVSLNPAELEETIEKVALGAVVFADLSSDPIRDVQFDLAQIADFTGETGPYLQYAHTRCLSLMRKGVEQKLNPDFSIDSFLKMNHTLEHALVRRIARFPLELDRMLHFRKPSQLSSFLIDLVKDFNAFYRELSVLDGTQKDQSKARLALVELTRKTLAQGLWILGIPLPSKM